MSSLVNACIGIGANLGHPLDAVRHGMQALEALPSSRVLATSRLYRTPAWGRLDQPDYINAAVVLQTGLAAQALLEHLLQIERKAGRKRGAEIASMRWGPRVLDLDILLFGEQTINEQGLRVPHPHLYERAFALVPLAEIAPNAMFPGHGSVAAALRLVDVGGVEAVGDD